MTKETLLKEIEKLQRRKYAIELKLKDKAKRLYYLEKQEEL
jgi:hypothetical protein